MCDRFRAGVSRLALVTLCVGVMVAPAWAQAGRLDRHRVDRERGPDTGRHGHR